MWPFKRKPKIRPWYHPFELIQVFCFITLMLGEACLPCVKVDLWGSQKETWRWRRMWKSDYKAEQEEQIRRERCCANDRDDWRERARRRGLMPQYANVRRTTLCVRESRYWLRTWTLHLVYVFGDTRITHCRPEPHLFKLPPEVREQIYIHSILEWSSVGLGRQVNQFGQSARRPIPPHEPPLTRVSKLVRAESLHVFYRTARFPLIAHPSRSWVPLNLPYPAIPWYYYLGPGKLSLIKHVELHLCLRRSVPGVADSLVFHVDFEPHGNTVSLVHAPWALNELSQGSWMAEHMQRFSEELLLHFRSVAHSLGSAGIVSAKDIYQFVA